jgi:hypothetical protein
MERHPRPPARPPAAGCLRTPSATPGCGAARHTCPSGGLCQGEQLKEAIRRYEQVWLPLLAAQKSEEARRQLAPPLDVAFIWHLHRLCGQTYETDVRAMLAGDSAAVHVEGDQVWGGHGSWGGRPACDCAACLTASGVWHSGAR